MSPRVFTEPSPRTTARLGGAFWLVTFVAGTFAMISYDVVVAGSDAARTAANLLARETLYRSGIAANVIATIAYVAATLFVFYLLKPVDERLSLLAAFFSLMGSAASCITFAFQLAPLAMLRNAAVGASQAHALLRAAQPASAVSFVFFGLHIFLVGTLIARSTFIPRLVGLLLLFGGIGWLTMGFSNLLSPPLARVLSPWIILPGVIGEGSLIVWLLAKGVRTGSSELL